MKALVLILIAIGSLNVMAANEDRNLALLLAGSSAKATNVRGTVAEILAKTISSKAGKVSEISNVCETKDLLASQTRYEICILYTHSESTTLISYQIQSNLQNGKASNPRLVPGSINVAKAN